PYGLLSLEQDSTNTDTFMSKGYSSPGSENVPEDVGWKLPSGGFMSNIVDMGRYMEMVLNYELLSQEYYDSLWTIRPIGGNPTFSCDTSDTGINESFNPGFGVQWVVSDDVSITNPNFIANHSGFNPTNSRTMLHLLPNKGLGVAILCNTTSAQAGNAVRKLRNILVGILDCPGNREFISLLGMGQSTVYEASTQIDASNWINIQDSLYLDAPLILLKEGFDILNIKDSNHLFRATDDGCAGLLDPGN
ncbi:MAG: serine hydrolase, partial [Saprospiraceae bacterium]|nr:serine hydrolase [Saprospiraceae bacterium]